MKFVLEAFTKRCREIPFWISSGQGIPGTFCDVKVLFIYVYICLCMYVCMYVYLLHGAVAFLTRYLENYFNFMMLKSSLAHLQEHATCPYPEPDRLSPCPHPTFRRSVLILFIHLWLDLQSAVCPSGFPPNPCMYLSFPLYVLYALPILVFLIWSPE